MKQIKNTNKQRSNKHIYLSWPVWGGEGESVVGACVQWICLIIHHYHDHYHDDDDDDDCHFLNDGDDVSVDQHINEDGDAGDDFLMVLTFIMMINCNSLDVVLS